MEFHPYGCQDSERLPVTVKCHSEKSSKIYSEIRENLSSQAQLRLTRDRAGVLRGSHWKMVDFFGGSMNGIPPIAGWFIMETPRKWMMTGGTPVLGNLHVIIKSEHRNKMNWDKMVEARRRNMELDVLYMSWGEQSLFL